MTYVQAIDFLYNELPVYQKSGVIAYKPSLDNIKTLCQALDNPQNKFKSIHIAGTNGKGSTAHMLSSILQEAGYSVGLHTSPHLVSFTERNKINGKEISETFVTEFIEKNINLIQDIQASFFEVVVAMGFDYFAKNQVDVAIIETGLGGRLDATNIINPLVAVISNIGLDHIKILGNSLEEIALEKAGIIKPNTPVIIGERRNNLIQLFKKIAKEKDAETYTPIDLPKDIELDLKGIYQKLNAESVLATIQVLTAQGFQISRENIYNGLKHVVRNTNLKGRWQIIKTTPYTVLDTAHNPAGFEQIKKQLDSIKNIQKFFVLGFVNDKNVKEILELLPPDATYFFCEPNISRALPIHELKKVVPKHYKANYYKNLLQAHQQAECLATKNDFIYIGGSNFIVGEFLTNIANT